MAGFAAFFFKPKVMHWNCYDAEAFMSCRVLWANYWIPGSPQLWEASSSLTQIRTSSWRFVGGGCSIHHFACPCAFVFPIMHYNYNCRAQGICWRFFCSSWMWSDLQVDYGRKILNPIKFLPFVKVDSVCRPLDDAVGKQQKSRKKYKWIV